VVAAPLLLLVLLPLAAADTSSGPAVSSPEVSAMRDVRINRPTHELNRHRHGVGSGGDVLRVRDRLVATPL